MISHTRLTRPVSRIVWFLPLTLGFMIGLHVQARATFSIVAVDTVSGIVGSAGASCIDGAQIIEGVVENVGAVNTQALWNARNQARADSMMRAGDPPDSIISFIVNHDAQNDGFNASDRQMGAVTIAGPGASAAHTGSSNGFWAGHRTGPGYSIQGNILLDSTIVEMMEDAYLSTPGPMEDRLMAALQAAKVQGADIRCWTLGKSTISAYVKVIHPGDGVNAYLDLVVPDTPDELDPIDLLQDQFDGWKTAQVADPDQSSLTVTPAGLPDLGVDTATVTVYPRNSEGLPPTQGAIVTLANSGTGTLLPVSDNGDGSHSARIVAGTETDTDSVTAYVDAGGEVIAIAQRAELLYYRCGDVNVDAVVTSADIIAMVNFVFKSGPPPQPLPASGDVDRSGALTSADIIFLVNFVFKSGTPPCN